MHIPDSFLSTQVWAPLDAIALPAIAYVSHKAQRTFDDLKLPLMGVMGAFVFAAQLVNFPVGIGTSGHLVGGALLAVTLGPAAATLVMAAILIIQAFVFQDGGVLALGANVINMAVLGVWAGYLPYRLWAGTRLRRFSIFAGAFLSVLVSALFALSELLVSGVPIHGSILAAQIVFFFVSATLEGIITIAVVNALEKMNAKFVRAPGETPRTPLIATALAALLLGTVGVLIASTNPDGIESLVHYNAVVAAAKSAFHAPLADYEFTLVSTPWVRKAAAGLLGIAGIYCVCLLVGRLIGRRTSADSEIIAAAARIADGD